MSVIQYALGLSLVATLFSCSTGEAVSPERISVGRGALSVSDQQRDSTPDPSQLFEMTLQPTNKVWDSRKPLSLNVLFRNVGDKSVFINLRSAFQFYGFLEDDAGHVFGISWSPLGVERIPVKDDYREILPGNTLTFTLNSRRIWSEVAAKRIPWRSHKRGNYKLYLQLASGSKKYLMPNQWEGTRLSKEVEIDVR